LARILRLEIAQMIRLLFARPPRHRSGQCRVNPYRKVYRAKINNRFGMSVVQPADRQAEEMERQERQFQAAMAELE